MLRVLPDRPWPLHGTAASRQVERALALTVPPHTLMRRAGFAVARLAAAVAPHARHIWVACGPGNNGGDGFEAAMHLKQWGRDVVVTWTGGEAKAPPDAKAALLRARTAGVSFASAPPARFDLAIDALLGLGTTRALDGDLATWADVMGASSTPVVSVDLPSGLSADTGTGDAVRATHTLSLLTLKPGLFTASGRDRAGVVWFDDLGGSNAGLPPDAMLSGLGAARPRSHDSHKGSYGDVAVVGGATGMTGAALLAGSGALHAGAGRVFVGLLGHDGMAVDARQPELMLRAWDTIDFRRMSVACGCGGGDAVRPALPRILSTARALVMDADALNAIAADTQLQSQLKSRGTRGLPTVLTPHPLEAARLLELTTADVQSDRIRAAQALADRFECVAVLKGSGTVIASPGETPHINPTGNALLATGGTGDVLAGVVAARLAAGEDAFVAAASAVYDHGLAADQWPEGTPLTASALARAI